MRFVFAHDGSIADAPDWSDPDWCVSYDELPALGPWSWQFCPYHERQLINRLIQECKRLDDHEITSAIFVGVQTSADHIYHLTRIGDDRFLHKPKKEGPPYEVQLEDEIMRPLVSGEEAKRYTVPKPETYILSPYDLTGERPRLFTQQEMAQQFPRAWSYLRGYEEDLRARESTRFDDEEWYRSGATKI